MRWMLVALAVMGLSGCAVGIKNDSSNATVAKFTVPVSYQEAYRRADAFARHCHTSTSGWNPSSFNVDGDLFTDTRTGVVRVNASGVGGDFERIEVVDGDPTQVTITAFKLSHWQGPEIMAARRSITEGKPVCSDEIDLYQPSK